MKQIQTSHILGLYISFFFKLCEVTYGNYGNYQAYMETITYDSFHVCLTQMFFFHF